MSRAAHNKLQNLMLTLYGGTNGTTALFSFGLNDVGGSGPTDLTNVAQGQGAAGFVIKIAGAELPAANLFDGSLRVGLAAIVGCTAADGCDAAGQFGTADGPESFTVTNVEGGGPQEEVPEPATSALLGGGLIALAWTLRRRKAS
jgi:hypothetical protein